MDTLFWEVLAGILVFAAGNIAYFEIRKWIQFWKSKSKSARGSHHTSFESTSHLPKP